MTVAYSQYLTRQNQKRKTDILLGKIGLQIRIFHTAIYFLNETNTYKNANISAYV